MKSSIFDCVSYLHMMLIQYGNVGPTKPDGLLEACVQAEATRHAGKLTAQASVVSGCATLIAGALAIGAATIAIWPELQQRRRKRFATATRLLDQLLPIRGMITTMVNHCNYVGSMHLWHSGVTTIVPGLPQEWTELIWLDTSELSPSCIKLFRKASEVCVNLHYMVSMLTDGTDRPLDSSLDRFIKAEHFPEIRNHYIAAQENLIELEKQLYRETGQDCWLSRFVSRLKTGLTKFGFLASASAFFRKR